jgi:hypothetical protein
MERFRWESDTQPDIRERLILRVQWGDLGFREEE